MHHRRDMHGAVLTCDQCERTFMTIKGLRTHRTLKHIPKTSSYTCPFCEQVFTRRDHLNRHMQLLCKENPVHSGLLPYRDFKERPMRFPDLNMTSGKIETFCRYAGCPKRTHSSTFKTLKKHYKNVHGKGFGRLMSNIPNVDQMAHKTGLEWIVRYSRSEPDLGDPPMPEKW